MAVCGSPLANQFRKPPEQFNINRDRLVISIFIKSEDSVISKSIADSLHIWNKFNSEWTRMNGCPPPLWFSDTELVGKPPLPNHPDNFSFCQKLLIDNNVKRPQRQPQAWPILCRSASQYKNEERTQKKKGKKWRFFGSRSPQKGPNYNEKNITILKSNLPKKIHFKLSVPSCMNVTN